MARGWGEVPPCSHAVPLAGGCSFIYIVCLLCTQQARDGIELHRYFYFFSLWTPLWFVVGWINEQAFRLLEYFLYREALYYMLNVQSTCRWVVHPGCDRPLALSLLPVFLMGLCRKERQ